MFIKLTRLDGNNTPIWINASFIVTVEPRRGGGSTVVPIGDGFDYDVREKPECILQLLEGVPVPEVIPVPTSDCLTKMPDDVSPEREPSPEPFVEKQVKAPDEESTAEEVVAKPIRKPRSRSTTTKATKTEAKKPRVAKKTKKTPLELSDDQVERLRKMAPGSIKKLQNTLLTQFIVSDVNATIRALEERKILTIDGAHIIWAP